MHPSRIFKTPEELNEAWEGYKLSLIEESKKWEKIQYVGKDGDKKIDYPKLPLTLDGFKIYCRKHYGEVQHYFDNTLDYYNEFCVICSQVREEIRNDQITGGLLGFYNPSITQRLNNLKEQTENTNNQNIKLLNIDPLADKESD